MPERPPSVIDRSTFAISDRLDDVRDHAGHEHGFISQETRSLSRSIYSVSTRAPTSLLERADLTGRSATPVHL